MGLSNENKYAIGNRHASLELSNTPIFFFFLSFIHLGNPAGAAVSSTIVLSRGKVVSSVLWAYVTNYTLYDYQTQS